MPGSDLRFIKRWTEFREVAELDSLPRERRGLYALLKQQPKGKFDVVYVGMCASGKRGGIKGRLRAHRRSKKKRDLWTHFSVFEVHDNIFDDEIRELEGLFRQIYRYDRRANNLNLQRSFRKLRTARVRDFKRWTANGQP